MNSAQLIRSRPFNMGIPLQAAGVIQTLTPPNKKLWNQTLILKAPITTAANDKFCAIYGKSFMIFVV